MSWLSLILALLKLANFAAEYARDRQLISAGEAQAIMQGNAATMERLGDARKGRDGMDAGDGGGDPEWAERVRRKYTRRD